MAWPLLLWRAENEDAMSAQVPIVQPRHRCPPNTAVGLGVLHIPFGCHAGVLVFGEWLHRTEQITSKFLFLGLRSELWPWYAARRLGHPNENLTQFPDVTPGLFGSIEDPKLKTMAAETRRMLLFLVRCLTLFFELSSLRDDGLSL